MVSTFFNSRSIGFPVYFSQVLKNVPQYIARIPLSVNANLPSFPKQTNLHRTTTNQYTQTNFYPIVVNRNALLELQTQIYNNYILYPYRYSCWYLISYRMILTNRLYSGVFHLKRNFKNLRQLIARNFVIRIQCFYRQFPNFRVT